MELLSGQIIKVYHSVHPNLFKVDLNMYHRVGVDDLEELYHTEGYKTSGPISWYYPERYLNINQQYELIDRAIMAGFDKITIVTQSPALLSTVYKNNITIVRLNGDPLMPNTDSNTYTLIHNLK